MGVVGAELPHATSVAEKTTGTTAAKRSGVCMRWHLIAGSASPSAPVDTQPIAARSQKPSWRLRQRFSSDMVGCRQGCDDVNHWFGEYLDAFAACGRGESETASLFEYYGVPLLITTGDGFYALTPGEQVAAGMQPVRRDARG